MVGFDSRPVVTELLCNKSLANVPQCGHASRLKLNLDPADPIENRNMENWNQRDSGTCLMVLLRAKAPRLLLWFLLCWVGV